MIHLIILLYTLSALSPEESGALFWCPAQMTTHLPSSSDSSYLVTSSLVWLGKAKAAFRDMNSCCCQYHDWRASTTTAHLSTCLFAGSWEWLMFGLIWSPQLCDSLSSIKNWNLFILQRGGFSFLVLRLDWVLDCEVVCLSWKWCIKILVSRAFSWLDVSKYHFYLPE